MTDPSTLTSDSWPAAPAAASPAGVCLSDDDVLAFAMGRLAPERHPAIGLHLDACELCQHLVSEAMHGLGSAPTQPLSESARAAWNTMFQPGTLVAERYLIRRFVARGGMGEVYEAFDQVLQQVVALKTVTSTASDSPSAVRRLTGEVQLARRVTHANVCRIFDIATHSLEEDGARVHFLTMEFVKGPTLGQSLREHGALPLVEAHKLARQLLLGLSAAHDAGVMHRDFKSDNVILRTEADGECTPIILDFGLARSLDQEAPSTSNPMGTLGYIAPEQLQGKPPSKASDVYSFGIVWFEMLAGKGPFSRELWGQKPYPPVPAPSTLNPRVSPALDALVLRCLQPSPADRFQDAGEVLAALDAVKKEAAPRVERRWLAPLALVACIAGAAAFRTTPPKPIATRPLITTVRSATPRGPEQQAPAPPDATSSPNADEQTIRNAVPRTKPAPQRPRPIVSGQRTGTASVITVPTVPTGTPPASSEPAPAPSLPSTKPLKLWERPFASTH